MEKTIEVSLEDEIYEYIRLNAEREDRTMSNMAQILIREAWKKRTAGKNA